MDCRILHIAGAAGAGTTTLAKAIQGQYGFEHLDTDDFFWESTDPPYIRKRERALRVELMEQAIRRAEKCVISGSLTDWGDVFIQKFDLVIYLHTSTEVRIERLRKREREKLGERVLPGGDYHELHEEFIKWAVKYDTAGTDMRSAALHREWLKKVPCPILSLSGETPCPDNLKLIYPYIMGSSEGI